MPTVCFEVWCLVCYRIAVAGTQAITSFAPVPQFSSGSCDFTLVTVLWGTQQQVNRSTLFSRDGDCIPRQGLQGGSHTS